MNNELIWVLSLLAITILLFISGKLRMDVIALCVIVAFVLSGTLTLQEATLGFSDPNVILIAALFVIGEGLVRTGVALNMGEWLVRVAGSSETKMLVFLMLTVAGLGAFMSSTGVVAIFIPVVLSVSARMGSSPARLMMPLSFAGLISGMMTLVATPPNLVVNSELLREGLTGFRFFDVTPVGVVALILGIGYMLVARKWLADPGQKGRGRALSFRKTAVDSLEGAPAKSQAPHAIFCMVLMVAMMLTNAIPNPIAAIIACLLMGKFRCIDMESAYRAIQWPGLILIIGMMPFALALQKTGGVTLIVEGLMDLAGGKSPHVMLLCLFILCATVGLFISNTATAVLMAPIGIAAAQQMGLSPYPFTLIIAVAASAAFMTPVSSPVNMLVIGPGGYRFSDFVKIGVPFTLMIMVVSVLLVPVLFPF